jgi:haloacid dehalogenase superfamily, subfamily IA, variant 3 with third motif having DD or ED
MKNHLALFDLDGTLFDTSDVNYYAYKDSLKHYNIQLDQEYFVKNCNGRHYTEFLPMIMENKEHLETVHKAKKINYVKNLYRARKNEHLFELIKLMQPEYHLAVVTTASRQNTIDIIRYFGYDSLFEYMITQEDITRVKPDPQGYLMAMEHFGITAENTVIFEDSEVGIQAAKATGASVMVIVQF